MNKDWKERRAWVIQILMENIPAAETTSVKPYVAVNVCGTFWAQQWDKASGRAHDWGEEQGLGLERNMSREGRLHKNLDSSSEMNMKPLEGFGVPSSPCPYHILFSSLFPFLSIKMVTFKEILV